VTLFAAERDREPGIEIPVSERNAVNHGNLRRALVRLMLALATPDGDRIAALGRPSRLMSVMHAPLR